MNDEARHNVDQENFFASLWLSSDRSRRRDDGLVILASKMTIAFLEGALLQLRKLAVDERDICVFDLLRRLIRRARGFWISICSERVAMRDPRGCMIWEVEHRSLTECFCARVSLRGEARIRCI